MAEQAKREAVLKAARELLLKQGFRATSMEAIAAEAGISKGTLYKYYGDKDAVFVELASGLLLTVLEEFAAGLRAKGTLTVRVAEALVAKYTVLNDYLEGSAYADELLDVHHTLVGPRVKVTEDECEAMLVKALREGGVREPERIAMVLDGAAYGIYRKGKGEMLDGIATVVEGVLRGV